MKNLIVALVAMTCALTASAFGECPNGQCQLQQGSQLQSGSPNYFSHLQGYNVITPRVLIETSYQNGGPATCTGPECALRNASLPVCTGPNCALSSAPTRSIFCKALSRYAIPSAKAKNATEVDFTFPSGEVLKVHREANGTYAAASTSNLTQRSNYQTAVKYGSGKSYVALKTPSVVGFLVLPSENFSDGPVKTLGNDNKTYRVSIEDNRLRSVLER